ncbi:AAA family ATPase [Neobacillus sp. PS3-34]|uniref:AAA family ATPase n=1 Tax=Neobacillus sp. PS3-34 TaxID=3070678 RepID=UPI0027DF96B7|nr:AAA family ATPase [Neobacillus sp. PS3-34]WML50169.1 AAA family ATPase [Neobacillus sp. PS3-34]
MDKLKINGVDYNSLFLANENFKRIETENFKRYLEENRMVFERLSLLLSETPLEHLYSSFSMSKVKNILSYLNRRMERLNRQTSINENSINGFGHWISDLSILVNSLRNSVHHTINFDLDSNEKYSLINIVDEVFTVTSYLKEKYQFLEINSKNKDLTLRLEENSKMIIDNLSLKSARYITTDNIEIMNIYKKIESEINKINDDIKKCLWSEFIDMDNLDKFNEFVLKRNILLNRIGIFNQTISKYANIKVELQNFNGVIFLKNSEEMAFEKLSSGERKITFLFLEILLNDVDIYLIDEPELSLSLNFQNKIITDLHVLTKGKTLFIATHAPYIYEDFIAIEGNISKEV